MYLIMKRELKKDIRRQVSHMIEQSMTIQELSKTMLVFIAQILVVSSIRKFIEMRKVLINQSREKLYFLLASAKLMISNINHSQLDQEDRNLGNMNMYKSTLPCFDVLGLSKCTLNSLPERALKMPKNVSSRLLKKLSDLSGSRITCSFMSASVRSSHVVE